MPGRGGINRPDDEERNDALRSAACLSSARGEEGLIDKHGSGMKAEALWARTLHSWDLWRVEAVLYTVRASVSVRL